MIDSVIVPTIERGEIVLSDKNFFSTEAYQGSGGEIDLEQIRYINRIATQGCKPDLSFIIDIPVEETIRR